MRIKCLNADRSGSQLEVGKIYDAVEVKNESEELIAYRINGVRTPSMVVGWDPERFEIVEESKILSIHEHSELLKALEIIYDFCKQLIDSFTKEEPTINALKNCIECKKFGEACIVGTVVKEVSDHIFSCWKSKEEKKSCNNCKHRECNAISHTCKACHFINNYGHWELKEEKWIIVNTRKEYLTPKENTNCFGFVFTPNPRNARIFTNPDIAREFISKSRQLRECKIVRLKV